MQDFGGTEILLPYNVSKQPLVNVSACPHPFESRRLDYAVPFGMTISEIIEYVQPDPVLREHGHVFINGELIERVWWSKVRPKPGTMISVRLLPSGGGGWRLAAMIGIAVLAIGLVAFGGPLLVPLVGVGMAPVIAGLGAAAFTFGATMLLNRLIPPPMPEMSKNVGRDSPTYAITGQRNTAQPWSKVPFVLGRFRLTPPYAALPFREIVGGQIYWRALFCLSHGPIFIEDLSIGSTGLGEFEGVEYEFRRGYWQLNYKGDWNPLSGQFPSANNSFGDTWTCIVAATIAGHAFSVGDTITYNGIGGDQWFWSWDINQEKPLNLFPSDVYEDGLQISIKYGQPQVRTTKNGADQIGIEIIFERGLVHIENNPPGKRSQNGAAIRIEQSPEDSGNWVIVTEQPIYDKRTVPIYWGWNWNPSLYGWANSTKSYDVRITRLTPDADEDRNFGNFTWYSLKTITLQNPVPVPAVAYLAMRIKASGQLSGTIDELNLIATSICKDWDDGSGQWLWRPTASPAALFRHVLQHPSRAGIHPADEKIDLARLQHWDNITRPVARNFHGVIDSKTSVYDVLTKICRVGRAVPMLRDLIMSVAIDEPKTVPIRMFTPRNSWDYSGKFVHSKIPNAYRVSFVNADKDYTADERIVYDDGYDANNATLIDRVEWVGITNSDQAWREGRYHLAQQRLGPETHTITTDFEYLACERGDLVALQHDAISVGLGTARVKDVILNSGYVIAIVIDNSVEMEAGKEYGFRVRRIDSGAMRTDLYKVYTAPGLQDVLYPIDTPLPSNGPAAGDLVAFGEYQRETLRVLVKDIEPKDNLTAVLTLVPEAAGVHTADVGAIPPYDPMITRPHALVAPVILNIQSDAKVMIVTAARVLLTRVVFTVRPSDIADVNTIVTFRPTGVDGQWQEATTQDETPSTIAITGPDSGGVYDFRLQRTHRAYLSSAATAVNAYHVIGGSGPPDGLQNLTIAISSGQLLLRWDLPQDIDVQFGGWILFRHSPVMDNASWPNSVSIGRTINGDQTHVWLPLKPGTYMGRVYDRDGIPSADIASVSTKQASILPFSPVMDMWEDPDFAGSKVNCEVSYGDPDLDSQADMDSVPSMDDAGLGEIPGLSLLATGDFDAVVNVDELLEWDLTAEAVVSAGRYYFEGGLDFLTVRRIRLTSHILSNAVNLYAMIDGDDDIDSMEDFDGTDGAPVDASIWVQITDDNPNIAPVWSKYMRIDSTEIEARSVGNVFCLLTTESPQNNIQVLELRLFADEVTPSGPPTARANGYSVNRAIGLWYTGSSGNAYGSASCIAVGTFSTIGSARAAATGTSLVSATSFCTSIADGSAVGTSTVTGVNPASSVAFSSGSATALATGSAGNLAAASSAGSSTVAAVGTTGGPIWVSSGTGSNVVFGVNPTPSYPATGIVPGNLAVLHLYVKGDSGGSLTPPGDWISMGADGTGGSDRQSTYYKVLSGTETGTITVTTAGSAGRRAAWIHVFSSAAAGTWSIENYDTETSGTGATTVSDNNVTTSGAGRLAINLIGYSNRQTTGQEAFTGTTGGSWVANSFFEAGSNPTLSVETAIMPSAGTIGGGSDASITASLAIVTGFAIYKTALSYDRVTYYAESTSRTTTNTIDYSVTKTSITFTPNAGKTYAIFGSAVCDGTTNHWQIKARLRNTTDAVTLWENQSDVSEIDTTYQKWSFGCLGLHTAGPSPTVHTFELQIASEYSGQSIGAAEANLFAIELVEGYDQWASSLGTTVSTTAAYNPKVSLSWSSSTSGNYVVFATAETNANDVPASAAMARLNVNSVGKNEHTQCMHVSNNEWENYVGSAVIQSAVGNQYAALEFGGTTTAACSIRNTAIVALRLDRFANSYWAEDRTSHDSTSSTYAVAAETASVTPAAVDHFIIGVGQMTTNYWDALTATSQRLRYGTNNVGTLFAHGRGWINLWWSWMSTKKITETAVAKTYNTQYARTAGTSTATVSENVVVVLQLTT